MSVEMLATPGQWVLGAILLLSCLGVLLMRKPVHASLCFMLALLCLSGLYMELEAVFIATLQVLVYAGAILVIFMFVIVLFQDAHDKIAIMKPQSTMLLLALGGSAFLLSMVFAGVRIISGIPPESNLPAGYGSVHSIGRALYFDFFFPFEAVILIFLVAVVGALYIAKKEKVR